MNQPAVNMQNAALNFQIGMKDYYFTFYYDKFYVIFFRNLDLACDIYLSSPQPKMLLLKEVSNHTAPVAPNSQ